MNFTTAEALLSLCREEKITVAQAMLRREQELNDATPQATLQKLNTAYGIMKNAVAEALVAPAKTMGGLIGGEAIRLQSQRKGGANLCGDTVSKAVCYAMGVLEVSASMGLIVAAPTAGASGVLPGVLIALQEEHSLPQETMTEGLLTASAVGYLVAENACIAGAQGKPGNQTGWSSSR